MAHVIRRVPKGWQHPKDEKGEYIPLFEGLLFLTHVANWVEQSEKWKYGLCKIDSYYEPIPEDYQGMSFVEWAGEKPNAEDYTPSWTFEEAQSYVMYEDITEGTPISPVFDTLEGFKSWCKHNID